MFGRACLISGFVLILASQSQETQKGAEILGCTGGGIMFVGVLFRAHDRHKR